MLTFNFVIDAGDIRIIFFTKNQLLINDNYPARLPVGSQAVNGNHNGYSFFVCNNKIYLAIKTALNGNKK